MVESSDEESDSSEGEEAENKVNRPPRQTPARSSKSRRAVRPQSEELSFVEDD